MMAGTAAKFESTNASLTSMLNRLLSDLSVLQSSWKGLAAGEFEKVKTRYSEDLRLLNEALAETAVSIRESGQGYDTTDADNAATVTKSAGNYTLPL